MSREGKVCPWELVEASIRATQPYDVFFLRSMLAVPYFEKVRAGGESSLMTGEN